MYHLVTLQRSCTSKYQSTSTFPIFLITPFHNIIIYSYFHSYCLLIYSSNSYHHFTILFLLEHFVHSKLMMESTYAMPNWNIFTEDILLNVNLQLPTLQFLPSFCHFISSRTFCTLKTYDGLNICNAKLKYFYRRYTAKCQLAVANSTKAMCGCFPKQLGQ